tara:strand:+ start:1380 stop:1907 length:528 start_codon:yes stop_codon:yes gene_type:complete
MIILSFDIGIKNLAYCMIDSEDKTILDWNVLDCSGQNETLRVIQEIDKLEYLTEADIVLLEKQPSFNPKMRNISTALYVYFIIRIQHEQNKWCKVIFYPAKYKLKCCNTNIEHKSKNKYRQNKNLGIVHTRELINSHEDFFEKHKKKDDLADCYLQAMSYIKFFINSNEQKTVAW